jgi:hypothetical protein
MVGYATITAIKEKALMFTRSVYKFVRLRPSLEASSGFILSGAEMYLNTSTKETGTFKRIAEMPYQ